MKRSRKMESKVAEYWLTHDSTEQIDWAEEPKVLAKDRDVPYQSFMKILLAEKVTEMRRKTG